MSEFVDKRLLMVLHRALLTGIFVVLSLSLGFSQEVTLSDADCDQKLARAESEFNDGHFYGIPATLSGCLSGGKLSKEQLVRAYLVLCQAYMILDDPIAAGDNYLKLLKADPEYVPNEKDDPIDIVYLSKQYTATPIFTPHFRLGVNTSFYRVIHSLTTEPYGSSTQSPIQLGFQVGAGIDWNINDNFSVCAEADLANRGYQRIITNSVTGDVANIKADMWWIDIPIYAKYSFSIDQQLKPFGYVGVALNYLLSASNQFSYTDNKSTGAQLVTEGPSESVISQRNQFSQSLVAGIGMRYKVGKNYVYADLRYMAGITNLAKEDKLYYQGGLSVDPTQIGNPNYYLSNNITRYHYTSDLFKMDNLSLTFGFVKPLYNPRKVKKARTKGVARSIRKEGGKEK